VFKFGQIRARFRTRISAKNTKKSKKLPVPRLAVELQAKPVDADIEIIIRMGTAPDPHADTSGRNLRKTGYFIGGRLFWPKHH
jgi:hypothetical protein